MSYALALALALPAAGLPTEEETARIDALARALVEEDGVTGLVVGTLRGGEAAFHGYGRVTRDSEREPDGRTVYEIGSITKTFTGILLAISVERGEVRLEDPLARHLPEGVEVPEWSGEPVRLVHLSAHTSGLPRLPADFRPKDLQNPYADLTYDALYAGLAKTELATRPGEKSAYSNLGAGLLGHALERAAGKSYEELVRERIARPLGMGDTTITLEGELAERLAPGYKPDGSPQSNWDIPTLAGAGALRSSARDMLLYARANLEPDGSSIASALRSSHEIRHAFPRGGGVALGWHWSADGATMWHNGGTGGYRSILVLNPEKKTAVVVLANTVNKKIDELGRKVLAVLLEEE